VRLPGLLATHPYLLLDFDGPMCAVFTAMSSAEVTAELAAALAVHGFELPRPLRDDPFAVLYRVHEEAPHLSAVAEGALTSLERRAVAGARPTAGLLELLQRLADLKRKVIVVSNNSESAVSDFVHAQELHHLLAGTVARSQSDPNLLKPNPFLVEIAASRLGVEPAACVLLGDSVTDVAAAKQAGAASIAFANKPGKTPALSAVGPDALIHGLDQINDALRPV
jgi:HAD superfamily hydrolase (TIGR01509 family)